MPDNRFYFPGVTQVNLPGGSPAAQATAPANTGPQLGFNTNGATWQIGWSWPKALGAAAFAIAFAIVGMHVSKDWSRDTGINAKEVATNRADNHREEVVAVANADAGKAAAEAALKARQEQAQADNARVAALEQRIDHVQDQTAAQLAQTTGAIVKALEKQPAVVTNTTTTTQRENTATTSAATPAPTATVVNQPMHLFHPAAPSAPYGSQPYGMAQAAPRVIFMPPPRRPCPPWHRCW